MRAAVDFDLLEIIAKASPEGGKLSPIEIASHLSTKNPDAPSIIDRILRLLASHSVVTCDLATGKDGRHDQRLYGLAPITKYFLHNDDGLSLVPKLTFATEKFVLEPWYHFKEATRDATPFVKAHGMHIFEPDLGSFNIVPGGKERTKKEFESLARRAGFTSLKLVCGAYGYWVMEFNKGSR